MTFQIVAVGKLKDRRHADVIAEYSKRLRSPWELKTIEVKEARGPRPEDVKTAEGTALLSLCDGRWVIALEESGKQYDSPTFSKTLQRWLDDGKKPTFVIGGAHGLSDEVRERADTTLSLSPLTFPHEMARAILVEQLYRAMAIANGSPYHK